LPEHSGQQRFAAWLLAGAAAMGLVACPFANRQTAEPLLGPMADWVDGITAAGQRLASLGDVALWVGLASTAAAWLVLALWISRGRPVSTTPIWGAAVVACTAQQALLDQSPWLGAALYTLAIAIYASRRSDQRLDDTSPGSVEAGQGWVLVGVLLSLGVFLLLAIHQLDVYPSFYFDEGAYLNAARMQAGTLEPGVVARYGSGTIYGFERFQFQRIPLWIQAAALLTMEPGLLALRLVSVGAMLSAIAVAAAGLRSRIGGAAVVGMAAMAAVSPLTLAYGRPAFYVSITVLHGVLCLLALLRLEQRWDARSAAVLGLLLGTSLYCYQLSWFVPVLALGVGVATPQLWRRPRVVKLCAIVAGSAGLVALPGLVLMPEGFRSVADQTFDKAGWNPAGGAPLAVVVAPPGVDRDGADEWATARRSETLTAMQSSTGIRPVVVLFGNEAEVDRALSDATGAGWYSLGGVVTRSVIDRVTSIAKRLFYAPGWESGGRWVDGALLNPWFAPLLVLGLVEAVRRRSVFVFRLLAFWVVAGALLPASIGGGFPRRTVLMLPVVFAVASLPWVAAYRASATRRSRTVAAGVSLLWLLAGGAYGVHHYFDHWDQRVSLGPSHPVLGFDKALNVLPRDQLVFAPRVLGRDWHYLHPAGSPRARRVIRVPDTEQFEVVRSRSCGAKPPFAWVFPDQPAMRERFVQLADDFVVRQQPIGPYRVLWVESRRSAGCVVDPPAAN